MLETIFAIIGSLLLIAIVGYIFTRLEGKDDTESV